MILVQPEGRLEARQVHERVGLSSEGVVEQVVLEALDLEVELLHGAMLLRTLRERPRRVQSGAFLEQLELTPTDDRACAVVTGVGKDTLAGTRTRRPCARMGWRKAAL